MASKFVDAVPLEVYSEKFKDYFKFKRENGILEVRAHTNDGPALWNFGMHRGIGQMFRYVGQDPENEVLIFTATGDVWFNMDMSVATDLKKRYEEDPKAYGHATYDEWYQDGRQLHEGVLNDIRIPTIAAINGPGGHTSFALMCDITLCTPDAAFQDYHFMQNLPSGEGQYMTMAHLVGVKRANYMSLLGKYMDAETALQLGVVNEVLEREDLLPRAWEIAQYIMDRKRVMRRFESEIMRRDWRNLLESDYYHEYYLQCWGASIEGAITGQDLEFIKKLQASKLDSDRRFHPEMPKPKEEEQK